MNRILLAILFSLGFVAIAHAEVCHNSRVTGTVVSPSAIKMVGFDCVVTGEAGYGLRLWYGHPFLSSPAELAGVPQRVTMSVYLKNPADVEKMKIGTSVTLGGNFSVTRDNRRHIDYLKVNDAEVFNSY